jgi:hypothetical protein
MGQPGRAGAAHQPESFEESPAAREYTPVLSPFTLARLRIRPILRLRVHEVPNPRNYDSFPVGTARVILEKRVRLEQAER